MTSGVTRALVIGAAGMLAVTPVVALAGTRAESSPVSVDIQRGSAAPGEQNLHGFSLAWILLLIATLAALIALLSDGRTRGG